MEISLTFSELFVFSLTNVLCLKEASPQANFSGMCLCRMVWGKYKGNLKLKFNLYTYSVSGSKKKNLLIDFSGFKI